MAHRQLLHLAPQLHDLLPLTPYQAAHHRQVGLGGLFQVTSDRQLRASVFAAGVLKGAQHQRTAAALLHVGGQVFTGDVGGPTLVGALNREARTVILMILDGVVDELFAAVLARLCTFWTLSHGVLGEEPPHHPCPTLILTVHTLLRTDALVVLEGLPRELAATELALDLAFGAVVLQVLRQVTARQLDGTAIGARDNVEGAGGEMTLQLLHLTCPAAALLTVDAADGQSQDLLLQFRIRIDLGIVQRELVLWALEDPLTEEFL